MAINHIVLPFVPYNAGRESKQRSNLIFEAMDWCRYSSLTIHEGVTGKPVHRHNWCISKKATKLYCFSHTFTYYRNQTHLLQQFLSVSDFPGNGADPAGF